VHQEDACQFTNRFPADKYFLSLRDVVEAMAAFVAAPLPQVLELLRRYAFSYLIGNADLHAKNISLYNSPTSHLVEQTPMYDIVSTAAYPQLSPNMALKMDGKDDHFHLADFVRFGERFGVPESAIVPALTTLVRRLGPLVARIDNMPYGEKDRERMKALIARRLADLSR